ncbi:MAG: uroporphyrinogen-III synthase [Gammaproteobacteria bacterium]|nr:uroporphyrinogen-III synthase [Gammaproteobacteria bacterium]
MPSLELAGIRVLVTRPVGQAHGLCQGIESQGGQCRCLPLLTIVAPSDPRPAVETLAHLARYQWLIFISANAVYQGWPFIQAAGGLPPGIVVAAVGQATAAAIVAHRGRVDHVPEQDFSSEGLLALPALYAVAGQAVLIVRGEGGKETLATELRRRGARVDYAQVYRREAVAAHLGALCDAAGQAEVDIIAISSAEALRHLAALAQAQHQAWVMARPLVVVHPRQVGLAQSLGFTLTPQVADNASDEAVVQAIIRICN